MQSFSDPIIVVCQLKSFQTNQMNLLKKKLKSIDSHAHIQLASQKTTLFARLCKSSTFVLTLSDYKSLNDVFGNMETLPSTFVDLQSTGIECLVLGAFFQNQALSLEEIIKLGSFKARKLNMLRNLSKMPKLPIFLKQRLQRLPFLLKANNGN